MWHVRSRFFRLAEQEWIFHSHEAAPITGVASKRMRRLMAVWGGHKVTHTILLPRCLRAHSCTEPHHTFQCLTDKQVHPTRSTTKPKAVGQGRGPHHRAETIPGDAVVMKMRQVKRKPQWQLKGSARLLPRSSAVHRMQKQYGCCKKVS